MEQTSTNVCQRLNEALDWLIYNKLATSRKDLARVIGFSESMLSLMANEKQAVSDKFLGSLARVAPMININWIVTGEGEMTQDVPPTGADAQILEAIQRQQEILTEANRTLGSLVGNCNEDIINRQMQLIESYQSDLSALIARSTLGGGAFVYNSNINSHNNSNNKYYGGTRGRKPNSVKK